MVALVIRCHTCTHSLYLYLVNFNLLISVFTRLIWFGWYARTSFPTAATISFHNSNQLKLINIPSIRESYINFENKFKIIIEWKCDSNLKFSKWLNKYCTNPTQLWAHWFCGELDYKFLSMAILDSTDITVLVLIDKDHKGILHIGVE